MNPRVVLQVRRARPFHAHHPWVFAGAISAVQGDPADGAEVDLVDYQGTFVARGFYNSKSKIRVRLFSWDASVSLDRSFFADRIRAAIALRESLPLGGPGQGVRLVASEGDGLSGLIVDRYDRWLVVQFTSLALAQRREMLANILAELTGVEGIYLRTERGIGALEGLELQDGPLWGSLPNEPIIIAEDGIRYVVNLAEGQKTGFYLDQRDNRRAVARLASGRKVLDAFCYSGGFGLHAAHAGATAIVGIDQSEAALVLARENAKLNHVEDRMSWRCGDVFAELQNLAREEARFGLIVLDPPKFARSRAAVDDALRAYRRLHGLALQLLGLDGFMVTCCCTGLITMDMLEAVLAQQAPEARRDIQVLERRGPAPDHPVSVACPESHYLKCIITRARAW